MITYDCDCKDVVITEGIFGEIYAEIFSYTDIERFSDESRLIPVKSYTMINKNRVEITVISWGATIVSLKYPDKYGHIADVVLGFDDLKSYMNPRINPFIGCILGRCVNRIKNGHIVIKGKTYQLTRNDLNNKHHLHGGTKGFGRRLWESHIDGCSVVMSYLSRDGEEGYPSAVLSTVRFKLTPDNKLEIGIRATTTNSTIVNISHGSLFNLAGHDAGQRELMKHEISLNCDRWTFANYADSIPTGSIRGVGGTIMDLRIPRALGSCIKKVPPGEGYDHNFCVTSNWHGSSTYVARAIHPRSGRVLEIYSDQPGVQFYTAGRLSPCVASEVSDLQLNGNHQNIDSNIAYDNNPNREEEYEHEAKTLTIDQMEKDTTSEHKTPDFILGKQGACYIKYCAFSIQPQNYPNAINIPHFPCPILQPGQVYCHDLIYKFGNQLTNYM
ncbi:aldose 1-epimerase [Ooceraea biroi]|uniref:aldose 1-epimerase n=1 Tax=Ooceraea biroi TaxID=2015173 RepID=UPI000F083A6F|nr:aldose 1-epimerase [Ooceraea biroi]